jgi:hypothetical protein
VNAATAVGTLNLSSGTLTLNATPTTNSGGTQSDGTLNGSGNLAIPMNATLTRSSGTMGGTGTTSVASNGTLAIAAQCCSNVVLDGRTLSNLGTITLSGSGLTGQNGARVINNSGALFDIQGTAARAWAS